MPTFEQLIRDRTFHAKSLEERRATLQAIDKEFASFDPATQNTVLQMGADKYGGPTILEQLFVEPAKAVAAGWSRGSGEIAHTGAGIAGMVGAKGLSDYLLGQAKAYTPPPAQGASNAMWDFLGALLPRVAKYAAPALAAPATAPAYGLLAAADLYPNAENISPGAATSQIGQATALGALPQYKALFNALSSTAGRFQGAFRPSVPKITPMATSPGGGWAPPSSEIPITPFALPKLPEGAIRPSPPISDQMRMLVLEKRFADTLKKYGPKSPRTRAAVAELRQIEGAGRWGQTEVPLNTEDLFAGPPSVASLPLSPLPPGAPVAPPLQRLPSQLADEEFIQQYFRSLFQ